MYDDQPAFTTYDNLMATHFANHPLGKSVLGTRESITALTSEQMRAYHADRYKAGNITLAVTGNTDFDTLIKLIEKHCSSIPAGTCDRDLPDVFATEKTEMITRESSVQQHVMQMGQAPKGKDSLRFAAELLGIVVGDD